VFFLIYNILLTIAYLIATPYFIYRLISDLWTGDAREWRQRLGVFHSDELPRPGAIWIHAASMGEVSAALPLVHELRRQYPEYPLYFTTMTRSGQRRARESAPQEVAVSFLPFDLFYSMQLLLKKVRPTALLLVETELWFNLMRLAKNSGAALYMVNGRLSEKSFAQYRRIRWGIEPTLRRIDHVFAQTEEYGRRFSDLGVPEERVTISGNTKNDNLLRLIPPNPGHIRKNLGIGDEEFVIVVGSSRPGEEEMLIPAIQEAAAIRWIIAPRHLNRMKEVENLLDHFGLNRSRYTETPSRSQIILVDLMGQLTNLYAIAQVAFVGGTLTDFGGHNLFEPAVWSKPVIFGQFTGNCQEQADALLSCGGGWQVTDQEGLRKLTSQLYRSFTKTDELKIAGKHARQAVERRARVSQNIVDQILLELQTIKI